MSRCFFNTCESHLSVREAKWQPDVVRKYRVLYIMYFLFSHWDYRCREFRTKFNVWHERILFLTEKKSGFLTPGSVLEYKQQSKTRLV